MKHLSDEEQRAFAAFCEDSGNQVDWRDLMPSGITTDDEWDFC